MGEKSVNIWFTAPERDRYDLMVDGHAFWIEVKRELNIGEQRKIETAGFKSMSGFGGADEERQTEIRIDWRAQSFARTETYLTSWSLQDGNGDKIKLTTDAIRSLRGDVYEAIEGALNKHVEKYEAEKKAKAGDSAPSATSA